MFPEPVFLPLPAAPPVAVYDSATPGPALLLLHGNSLDSPSTYAALWDEPALAGFRRVAFDWPGCGASPATATAGRISALVATLGTVVTALGLTDYLLVAHSLGGHAALEALPRLPVAPRGVLLVATPPLGSTADLAAAFQSEDWVGLLYQADLTDAQLATLASALLLPTAPTTHHAALASAVRRSVPAFRPALADSIGVGEIIDERANARQTAVPLAFAQGATEGLVDAAYVRAVDAPTRWGMPLHVIPNAAHLPMLENPSAFAALVADFARSIDLRTE